MKWDHGHTADMRVERVEEPAVFGFTWHIYGLPDEDPRRTYVEFTLEPSGPGDPADCGGIRLQPAAGGRLPEAFDGNTKGWASELGELADYLDAA